MADVYVASQEMMDNRPEELRATLKVIYQSLAYMKANRAWSLEYLKEFAKSDSDEVTSALYDKIIPKLSADGRIDIRWVAEGLKLAARAWEIPELASVKPETLFTNDFIPGAK
jgi:ABC-type nitrate/sulfonate/bicarbonate transport system substrate-binding protein